MTDGETLLQVGRIGRAHGLRGQVHVELITDRTERLSTGSRLRGGERWLEVDTAARHGDHWLVHFVGIDDRVAAESIASRPLLAEPIEDPDALWVHEVIGSRVVEVGGTDRGRCVSVIANPGNDLLELESGALVPTPFVTSVAEGVVTIDPPEGLFD